MGEFALVEEENRCANSTSDTSVDSQGPLRSDGSPVEEPTDNSALLPGRGFLYA